MADRDCLLCGSRESRAIIHCRDALVTGEEFQIRSCLRCGVQFTSPRPTRSEIDRYYASKDYAPLTGSRSGTLDRLLHATRILSMRWKRWVIESETSRRTGRLLDYGCGTGEFAAMMVRSGWSTDAVEHDAGARSRAKKLGLQLNTPETALAWPRARFDAITLWQVIEHVHDPGALLATIRHLLRPDGRLFMACPNPDSLDAQALGADWAAWDVPRHLWHFTPSAMGRLLAEHGLRVRRVQPMPFDPFYIALLSRERGARICLTAALGLACRSWVEGMRRPERSSNLLYVVERVNTEDIP